MMPQLASPEMTGEWEKKLKQMEQGRYAYKNFMSEVREMVANGVRLVRSSPIRTPRCPVRDKQTAVAAAGE